MAFIFKISFLGFLKQNLIDLLTKSTTEEPLIAMVPQEKSTLFTFSFVPAPSWSWSQTCIIWCLGKVPMSGPTTDLFEFCSWEFRCWAVLLGPTTHLVLLRPTEGFRWSADPRPFHGSPPTIANTSSGSPWLSFVLSPFLDFSFRLSLLVSFLSGWLGTILCSLANQCFAMPGQLFLPPLIAPPSFIWRWLLMPTHYHFLHTFKDHLRSGKLRDFSFFQVFPSFSSSAVFTFDPSFRSLFLQLHLIADFGIVPWDIFVSSTDETSTLIFPIIILFVFLSLGHSPTVQCSVYWWFFWNER